MKPDPSQIHDGSLLSYTVTAANREIVMRIRPEDDNSNIFEVTFSDAVAYQFKNDAFGTALYGIEEIDPLTVIKDNWEEIQDGRVQSGWVGAWAADLESAKAYLERELIRAFEISSSIGLSGWILGKSMTIV